MSLKFACAVAAMLTMGSILSCGNTPGGDGDEAIVFTKDVVTYTSTGFGVQAGKIYAGNVYIKDGDYYGSWDGLAVYNICEV